MTGSVRSASLAVAVVSAVLLHGSAQASADGSRGGVGWSAVGAPTGMEELVDLVVRRLLLADEVAAAKLAGDRPIDDPARERRLLDTVAAESARAGLPPEDGVRFFRAQIEAGKRVQRGLHARWRAHPELRPRRHADLETEIRPRLDRLTPRLLRLLKETAPVRASVGRCWAASAAARLDVEARTGLDRLHRDALDAALVPLCARSGRARQGMPGS
ncbi:gamma subclass chorismate mutase AroQ [Nonomuraea sp. PA05]|uniref:gamma subclass chorismate mutase AroQ n=1 Tax=Nonomuraea sp. PA05 TaxID=2604466 RepID=UPI0011DA8858|nr:gamma subclass chorismate mutase AroQ [Nonomuraea sp. PA05]TYB54330.1 gamma subclass chorismate mutase AroQ [Nonomuraea sp. PA05]